MLLNPELETLVAEPEPRELDELEAPKDDPDPELETLLLPLLREEVDVVTAMGFEVVFEIPDAERGSAIVTAWAGPLKPWAGN